MSSKKMSNRSFKSTLLKNRGKSSSSWRDNLCLLVAKMVVCVRIVPKFCRPVGSVLSLLAIFLTSTLSAQPANNNPTTSLETSNLTADLNRRLAHARALLNEAQMDGPLLPGETQEDRLTKRVVLSQIIQAYQGHLFALLDLDSAKTLLDRIRNERRNWQGFAEGPPYSLLLADALRETVNTQDLKIQACNAIKEFISSTGDNTRRALKIYETNIRRFTESLESATDPAQKEKLRVALDLETLRSQFASAELASFAAQANLADVEQLGANERRDFAQAQLAIIAGQTFFRKPDLDRVTAQIEKEINALEVRSNELNATESLRQADLKQANAELESAKQTSAKAPELPVLQETVALRTDQLDTKRVRLELQRMAIEGYRLAQHVYQYRHVLANTENLPGVRESSLRLDESTNELNSLRTYLNALIELTRGQLTEQESRLRMFPADSPLLPLIQQRLASLRERLDAINGVVDSVGSLNRLIARWSETVADSQHHLSLLDRLQLAFRNTQNLFERLWNFELYNAVDTIEVNGQKITGRRSVTVGKVIQVLLILVIGYVLCRLLAILVERTASRRLKVPEQTARILAKWMLGVFLSMLIVFSLIWVKIPFEAFAFVGGALAIGIGFGMQNLLKNLISGIIILIERPLRLGDIVEISGTRGEVTNIGLRSSVIRRSDGVEVLVPNSTFLENSVTNLTYSSKNLQSTIAVAVAYGSSVRKTTQLLIQIADEHGLVLKKPGPAVTLSEFADKGLLFTLSYWINLAEANALQVGSDLRRMILHRLTENGIAISNMPVELVASAPEAVQAESGSKPRPDKK
jgi:potassium efflux system protein